MQQLAQQRLPLLGPAGELLPAVVPARLVRREVGYHRAEGRAQRAHIGRDGTAARSGRFARRLLSEPFAGHVDKPLLLILRFKQVFDHFFLGIEGFQVVQPHRLDGDADDLLLGDARRTLLFAEEIPPRFQQGAFRHETHDLSARHTHAAGIGLAAHLVESDM